MLERLGGDARQVMAVAEDQARSLGSPVVGCAHLLLALAETGAIEGGLEGAGITYADMRAAMAAKVRPSAMSLPGRLPIDAPLLDVLRGSWRRSVTDKGGSITTAHLVAQLIEDRPTDVVRPLGALGVRIEDLGMAPLPRSIRRRKAVTSRLFSGAAAPQFPDDWDPDDDHLASAPPAGDARQRHPSKVAQRATRTLRAVVAHDAQRAEGRRAAPVETPPRTSTRWVDPGWTVANRTEPSNRIDLEDDLDDWDDEPPGRVRIDAPPAAAPTRGRRPPPDWVPAREAVVDDVIDDRRPTRLPRRRRAVELVCPHCDDELDAVLLDLDIDGRDVEAMACPSCHVLLAAWPA